MLETRTEWLERASVRVVTGHASLGDRLAVREGVKSLLLETRALRYALERIRAESGKVCNHYETCQHESCASSYAAWTIADEALKVTGGGDDA